MKFSTVSPCKLNLFLYITGKRPDGYHNLQTLFVILDHGDIMHFETTDDDRVELLTDFGFPVEKNLIYKAAMLLKEQTLCKKGVKISIDKVLPQGGGLGGGSGNAATTLMVLNRLWDLKLKEDSLLKMGTSLGADVPIFIKGKTCFAEGIGEILEEKSYPEKYYLVATPECKVPTAKLFGSEALKKDSKVRTFEELVNAPFENCFTPVVVKEYPEVQTLLDTLSEFGPSFMSGSGSSCFVAFDSIEAAKKAQAKIEKLKISSFVARSVKVSNVIEDLNKLQ
ncbi:MAG: 4-(cytidine 5'-diphospho)-2-C-methyl-D-erythritol kinase [Succinivibrio sp.]|nr:4-(cytidine 5'-diphospho)-2-C-methyl-D-erythritol kinase [Succinivibrio sp.]